MITANPAAAAPVPLLAELKTRSMLTIFFLLMAVGGDIALSKFSTNAGYYALASLVEILTILIAARVGGDKSITRDLIELNGYALLAHLIYIPFFFNYTDPVYHHTTIRGLIFLAIIRLCYFGPRTADGDFKGWPTFGLLGHARQWLAHSRLGQSRRFLDYAPATLFFGSALPIWLALARTSDLISATALVGAMGFVFFMANQLHAEHTRLRSALAQAQARANADAPAPTHTASPADAPAPASAAAPVGRPGVRSVAAQLIDAYERTHPNLRALAPAMARYLERAFPDASLFDPQSVDALRSTIFKQLLELRFIAKERYRVVQASGQTREFHQLSHHFESALRFDLGGAEFQAWMDLVLAMPHYTEAESTVILTCDVLITAWLQVLLVEGAPFHMNQFRQLDDMTRAFVAKYVPHDFDGENDLPLA
jgi:hypothetical protein